MQLPHSSGDSGWSRGADGCSAESPARDSWQKSQQACTPLCKISLSQQTMHNTGHARMYAANTMERTLFILSISYPKGAVFGNLGLMTRIAQQRQGHHENRKSIAPAGQDSKGFRPEPLISYASPIAKQPQLASERQTATGPHHQAR
jgi:hypothetical protein